VQRLSKPLVFILILLLGFAVLAGCGGSSTTTAPAASTTTGGTNGTLTYGMSGLYKPFNFVKNGQLIGFDVEIGKALAEKMGMTPNPVTNPWETIIEGLQAKKYDCIIGSMAITAERSKAVNFTDPYYRSGAQIFVSIDNTTVTGPDSLRGQNIGVVKASTFKDIAVTLTDPSKVVTYSSDVIALQDLLTGRTAAVICDAVVGYSAINADHLKIKPVGNPLYVDKMGIAVRKDEPALLANLNTALAAIIADGTYNKISLKWLGRNILGQ